MGRGEGKFPMDLRPDILDLADQDERDEESYEPGWYSILKESALAATNVETAPQAL